MATCPLCATLGCALYYRDPRAALDYREYRQCSQCSLVFVPPAWWPDISRERAEYALHDADESAGYRRFLERILQPVEPNLPSGARVLDFGCGRSALLARICIELGYRAWSYDPVFRPDGAVLEQSYQAIFCVEVLEHVHRPGELMPQLCAMLDAGGCLAIMTKRPSSPQAFANWHYIRDITHVCFYSAATFEWIARWLGLRLELPSSDCALLRAPAGGS